MFAKLNLLIATGFGAGFLRPFPGTYGTLEGVAVYMLLKILNVSEISYLLVAVALFYVGVYTSTKSEIILNKKDCPAIVIDEIMGYLLTMFLIPFTFWTIIISFPVNRFFDVQKPFPARNIHVLKGGWGVMFDDLVSGIYSNLAMHILVFLLFKAPPMAPS